jgi:cytochrome c oxidase cbb3-type subunit 3
MTNEDRTESDVTILSGEENLLLAHEADGIKELDNNLPKWWVWLFYLSIGFAVFYMCYYHVFGIGRLSAAEYTDEMKIGEALKSAAAEKFQAELTTLEPSTDEIILAQGNQTFVTLCAPCHRNDGGGLVGPNLCDNYWVHGESFSENLRIVIDGNPVKGMIAWKDMLPPKEIYAVTSYIYTLRGSNPENPKPPENQVSTEPEGPSEFE